MTAAATVSSKDHAAAMRDLRSICLPSHSGIAEQELTRMRALTKMRDDETAAMTAVAMLDELTAYPDDIIAYVCRRWTRENKFFPTWSELYDACERLMTPRRTLWDSLANVEITDGQN